MDRINNTQKSWCGDRTLKILLIEDNPDHAQIITNMVAEIKDLPFELKFAEQLSTGLERLAKGDVEAVLLDLMLPDSQGIETFVKTHAQVPDVPVIILSTLDDEKFAS